MYICVYLSRGLSKLEEKYGDSRELELCAIVYALEKLRHYLLGKTVTLVTDHQNLRWINNISRPSGKLVRWALKLSEFDLLIKHRSGAQSRNVDALSRMYENKNPREVGVKELLPLKVVLKPTHLTAENLETRPSLNAQPEDLPNNRRMQRTDARPI